MKSILFTASVVFLAAAMTACSGTQQSSDVTGAYVEINADDSIESESIATEASEAEHLEYSCKDITAKILESVEFPSMAEVGIDRVGIYLDCEIPTESDFSMFICGSGGFADEICVINTSSIDEAAFEDAVNRRVEARKKDFEGYNPDEYDKLDNFYFESANGYCIYAVTADNEISAAIFEEFVKN